MRNEKVSLDVYPVYFIDRLTQEMINIHVTCYPWRINSIEDSRGRIETSGKNRQCLHMCYNRAKKI